MGRLHGAVGVAGVVAAARRFIPLKNLLMPARGGWNEGEGA